MSKKMKFLSVVNSSLLIFCYRKWEGIVFFIGTFSYQRRLTQTEVPSFHREVIEAWKEFAPGE